MQNLLQGRPQQRNGSALVILSALLAGLVWGASGAVQAQARDETEAAGTPASPQTIEVELYPAPEAYRMGGIPPGMTAQSFMAGRGVLEATALDAERTRLAFTFEGLIPNGVYTLWNVLEPLPDFSDEPLGPEGFGKHGVIADADGRARAVVILDKRPGEIFLLDYHSDGALSGEKGETVFPGALWAGFPQFD